MTTFVSSVKKELILWYLNYDDINITDKEIYDYSKLYNIPYQIFLKKLLERFVTMHNYDINIILDIMQNKMNLELSKEAEQYLRDLLPLIKSININNRKECDISKLNKIISYFYKLDIITDKKPTHEGQPLPHVQQGRPYIDWLRCYHENCYERFDKENDLIKHLKKFKVYTPNYHNFHEAEINVLKLTEEKVIQENITKCPAAICKDNNFNTPQQLIEHFQRLGLEPFWKKGMIIKNKKDYNFDPKVKIFNVDECVICCEAKPNLIFDNCLHCCFCIECYEADLQYNSIKKCPICRESYNKIYPY
jgi:hypothetical protein